MSTVRRTSGLQNIYPRRAAPPVAEMGRGAKQRALDRASMTRRTAGHTRARDLTRNPFQKPGQTGQRMARRRAAHGPSDHPLHLKERLEIQVLPRRHGDKHNGFNQGEV